MLHPGFFASDQMAQLSLAAAYTYEGIWCFADDRGRKLFNASEVWAEVWLKRSNEVAVDDVATFLGELIQHRQLCRYRVGGGDFIHVIAWDEHQKISHPTPSKLPPCPDHQPAEWAVWWKDDDTATDRWRREEKAAKSARQSGSPERLRNDSGESYTQDVDTSPDMPSPGAMPSESTPERLRRDSGETPPQCSSVQLSSDQATGGQVRQFTRPSQRGIS